MPETKRVKEMQARGRPPGAPSGIKVALANLHALTVTHGRRFYAMLGVTAPLAIGVTSATVLFPTFLQADVGLPPHIVTAIYVGGGLFGLFGNFIAGRLSDKHGRKIVFAIAGVAFIGAMLGLYLGPHVLVLIGLLWGVSIFAFFALEVVMGAWSAELFPTEQRSTASGARLAVNIIAGGAALLAQSFLYDALGGHAPAIAVLLPALVVAVIVAWLTIPETAGKTLEQIADEGKRPD
jgi:predicted MFS family arabinose efflux permease